MSVPADSRVLAAVAVAALALSWLVVGLVRSVALRRGLLDIPNERSSHVAPTPRLGGIGILVAIAATTAVGAAAIGTLTARLVLVLALAAALSLVSLRDDLRGLPALVRLTVHLTTAGLAVWWLGPLDLSRVWPAAGAASGLAAQAVTVLWLAGFINAFNFMDGTDGIAALQALIAGASWSLAFAWGHDPAAVLLACAITAASAGFLVHNWSPASIFMGDVGSAPLGFLLAVLPLLVEPPVSLLTAVLPVWPFVFDTAFTLVRRAGRGENLLEAHRSHLYQRLAGCGWSHGRIALVYGGLAMAGALIAVATAAGSLHSAIPALTLLGAGPAILWGTVTAEEARRRRTGNGGSTRRSSHA